MRISLSYTTGTGAKYFFTFTGDTVTVQWVYLFDFQYAYTESAQMGRSQMSLGARLVHEIGQKSDCFSVL